MRGFARYEHPRSYRNSFVILSASEGSAFALCADSLGSAAEFQKSNDLLMSYDSQMQILRCAQDDHCLYTKNI
jgi:hypothetical protein